jgi:hypothetical protein
MTIGAIIKAYRDAAFIKFDFLRSVYDFRLKDVTIKPGVCYIEYEKKGLLISLGYELIEKRFFYYLNDGKTVVIFHEFFKRYDESINWPELMPLDEDYEKAMDKNIGLLKKYGHGFLTGEERL